MEYFATVADKRFILDWDKLPDTSKERIIRYGVQRIVNDRCGGADRTVEEKHELAAKMVEALVTGTVPARGNGGVDPILVETRRLALKAWLAKDSKREKPDDKTARDELADKILAAVPAEVRAKLEAMGAAEVKRKLAEREAKRNAAAKVSDAMGEIDL